VIAPPQIASAVGGTRPQVGYIGNAHEIQVLLHRPVGDPVSTVVLVEPFGIEALAAEATFRRLTLDLVEAGHAVLRFSPPGAGDSGDIDDGTSLVGPWIASVEEVIRLARSVGPCGTVDVVALRLGATIAGYAVRRTPVRRLVLWAPVAGKAFAREFKLLGVTGRVVEAPAAVRPTDEATRGGQPLRPVGTEAGGFVLYASSVEELSGLDLRAIERLGADDVLLVERDDVACTDRILANLTSLGCSMSTASPRGFADMRLDDPEEGIVPVESLHAIGAWLRAASTCGRRSPTGSLPAGRSGVPASAGPVASCGPSFSPTLTVGRRSGFAVVESPVWIDAGDTALFGIITRPSDDTATMAAPHPSVGPAVILLTTGSNPRCGAGRLQTGLARRLAEAGHTVVRYDRRGVGASHAAGASGGTTNGAKPAGQVAGVDAYDTVHVHDLERVIDYLVGGLGQKDFVVVGMCSGAFTAFHLTRSQGTGRPVPRAIVSLNQIIFMDRSWTTKAESPAMAVKAGYELRRSWRDISKWKTLVAGDISLMRTVIRLSVLTRMQIKKRLDTLLEKGGLRPPGPVAQQLTAIAGNGTRQLYVYDEAETGLGHLRLEAGPALAGLAGTGSLKVLTVAGAGHTFGPAWSKRWLEDLLVRELANPGDRRG
jgi:pimeloyl-ACP methyl ester carboxylesterase